MTSDSSFILNNEDIHALLLEMAQQRTADSLFDVVVSGLAGLNQVALARMWVVKPGDICQECWLKDDCHHKTTCLHLIASAGQSKAEPGLYWTNIQGKYSRFPLGTRKVGHIATTGKPVIVKHITKESRWIADFDWASREGLSSFAGQPLVFQGKVLGVLAVFTRAEVTDQALNTLRVIADHTAATLANAHAFEEIEQLKQKLEIENSYLREELFDVSTQGGFIGSSMMLQQIVSQIEIVAQTNACVLALGESGTGKELVAREIYHRSKRKDKPMIKVNCASIPKDLFESEFFGHAKGAFTGALKDRDGRFGAADGGTLFLDEIGEIPLEYQGKLLRVIQEGEYERVGENRTRKCDVRLIAATNKDLEEEIKAGRFREDLYFRLNVFPIRVPPLRKRKDDIEHLANHFLQLALEEMNLPQQHFTPDQIHLLQQYEWPGNVRELRNIVERAAIFCHTGPLQLQLQPQTEMENVDTCQSEPPPQSDSRRIYTEQELVNLQKENTRTALIQCKWKIYGQDGAAALLGIKPTTLSTRIKKMGLKEER